MGTGVIFDSDFFAGHNKSQHAENAQRLSLLDGFAGLTKVDHRPATDHELLAIHTPEHLEAISSFCSNGGGFLDPDTYCGTKSESIARSASGGLIDLCSSVRAGQLDNGLAIVRPPGHHATSDRAMGFCLYNHVAVAAAALIAQGVSKVCIVDFDVHHGNGTQDIFYEDDSVLYLSSHQYPHYPGTGALTDTGQGQGLGFTLNHPLEAGSGDDEFLDAYRNHLLPRMVEFEPDFILISAGYDGHVDDPLAGLNITTSGFRKLVDLLIQSASQLCQGKIVFVLEGGYNPQALADCLEQTYQSLNEGSF